jgi:hypothetical protein
MLQHSILVATSDDSSQVTALDAATGAALWSTPLPAPDARLLCVDERHALLTGRRLWAIQLADGSIDSTWASELIGGAGQGAATGEIVFWPTAAEIMLIDRASGRPLPATLGLPAIGGAHIVVASLGPDAPEYIVAAGPGHATAYRPADTSGNGSEAVNGSDQAR